MVANLLNHNTPPAHLGLQAKQRSTHNNYLTLPYLTLPVVLVMLSNHYPLLFGHDYIWVVTLFLFVIGATIRHFFNTHHHGLHGVHILWQWPVAMILSIFLLAFLYHRPELVALRDTPTISDKQAFAIVTERCVTCHSARPVHPLITIHHLLMSALIGKITSNSLQKLSSNKLYFPVLFPLVTKPTSQMKNDCFWVLG